MPEFSVVISVYNKQDYIGKTLQSVMDQTFTDFEIIVVNDGSTDDSEKVILEFDDKRIKYFPQENQGAGAGRNAAIKKASGEWIALLDADDRWYPEYLAEIHRMISTYPGQYVFATAIAINKAGSTILPNYSVHNLKKDEVRVLDFFKSSLIDSLLTSSSTVLHRKVLDEAGLYDPSIKSGQDTDLWIRVGLKYDIVFLNKICAVYEYAYQSLSKTAKRIDDKSNFEDYKEYEASRPEVKKFMDLNRYSLSILAKSRKDRKAFKFYTGNIDRPNLNRKQRILLNMPGWALRKLYRFKHILERKGFYLSTFK
jgi:glycosyltransferase involved in cell wall biosynthesis